MNANRLKRDRNGLTWVELIIATVVIAAVIAIIAPLIANRVQRSRNQRAWATPAQYFSVACSPVQESVEAGDPITIICDVSNVSTVPLDYQWGDRAFMLSTDQGAGRNPGYPVPPASIDIGNTRVVLDREGNPTKITLHEGGVRLNPGDLVRYTIEVGKARGKGFKGRIMVEYIGGAFGDAYDLRDPKQAPLIDDRYLISNEIHYDVIRGSGTALEQE